MARLSFSNLVAKVQRGSLTPAEVARYFELDPIRTTGLHPRFRLNLANVDVAGLQGTAVEAGHALAVEAGFAILANRPQAGRAPDGLIVAEGDSWFRLPHFIYPPTMIDVLQETYAITNIAHWGDELTEMYNGGRGQYLAYLKRPVPPSMFLFSGGGNDVLGVDFARCLRLFDIDHTRPEDAPYYLDDFFYERLDRVVSEYAQILVDIRKYAPTSKLYVHGYDYAVPRENGIFLGVHMATRGLHPADRPELCRAIVRLMIDRFNRALETLERQHPANFIHVDLRNTVGEDDWYDQEIHPDRAACERLAQRFATHLGPPPGIAVASRDGGTRPSASGGKAARAGARGARRNA